MTGVVNQPTTQRENPLLTKIATDAEAKVPENLKGQFLSIMVAGGKLMWSPEVADERRVFDQTLQEHGSVPDVVAHTVLKICSIIQQESKQKDPLAAIGLAAPIFMAHALQYVEGRHGIPITKDIIDQTAQLVQVNLLKMYGVTEAHIQELLKQRAQGASPSMAPSGTPGNADEEAAEGTPNATDSPAEEQGEEA